MSLFILLCEEEMGAGVNLKLLFFLNVDIKSDKQTGGEQKPQQKQQKYSESSGSIQCYNLCDM